MEHDIDVLGRPQEAVPVAHVTDEESHVRPRAKPLALVELLALIAPEHPHDGRLGRK